MLASTQMATQRGQMKMSQELRRQEKVLIDMEKKKMAQDIMIFNVAISFWTSGVAPGNNFSRVYSSL